MAGLRSPCSVRAFNDGKPHGVLTPHLTENMQRALGTCASLAKVYADISTVDHSQRWTHLAQDAPKAILECSCGVADLDLTEYLLIATPAVDYRHTWIALKRSHPGMADGATTSVLRP